MPLDSMHLTADDLDTLLIDRPTDQISSHLATCSACARMVAGDAQLVAALRALPLFDPDAGFAQRVMAGVTPPVFAAPPVMVGSPRALAARRRAIGAAALTGTVLVGGFVWAYAHPSDALRWSSPAVQSTGHAMWLSLQHLVAEAIDQPWFSTVRDAVTTPGRALLAATIVASAYALALLGLRGLMTEPATDAGW